MQTVVLILLVYMVGCQLAITVFAARMALDYEHHDITFDSFAAFRGSVGAYFARLLGFAFLWPLNLWRWLRGAPAL